jgi:hypothetical protein
MISYEGWILIIVMLVWTVGAIRIFCPQCIRERRSTAVPDPIEIEARRLAEIEIEEFCALIEGNLEPVKTVVVNDAGWNSEQRRDYLKDHGRDSLEDLRRLLTTPVESILDSYCLGCGKGTAWNDPHTHVFNMMGEAVGCYPA